MPESPAIPPVAVPLITVGRAGPLALAEGAPDQAAELIAAGRRQFGGWPVSLLDRWSARWARRAGGPYLAEVERAASLPLPRGLWFMNYAYEWGCTTSAGPDPAAAGVRLLRTLDWPFHGLGRQLVVLQQEGAAGAFYNVTWPGYLGVVSAMAPDRFCVAINQAPVLRRGPAWLPRPRLADWLVSRRRTFSGDRIAPAHLLRQVCEDCTSFAEAKERLMTTPIALPVFYTLAGLEPGEACVIERLEDQAFVHRDPAAVANHWLSPHLRGRPRGRQSQARLARMADHCGRVASGFEWLDGGILNPDTRLALVANAASGQLLLRGYEKDGAATAVFDLAAACPRALDRDPRSCETVARRTVAD